MRLSYSKTKFDVLNTIKHCLWCLLFMWTKIRLLNLVTISKEEGDGRHGICVRICVIVVMAVMVVEDFSK